MKYSIKELYYTIQGEGVHAGRAAIFCRFSGCNLWTGLEKDRHKAICQFCDTDFHGTDGPGGGKYTAMTLVEKCNDLWPAGQENKMIVCTGGEPLLQLDKALIDALHQAHWYIAIETNGTIEPPQNIDWVCVSPKHGAELIIIKGQELKLVHPQQGQRPSDFEQLDFEHFSLQPLEDTNWKNNTELCLDYCKSHPKWRLSIQTHKYLGIP
jgi:7-carboxy-7-deazaguanine synthase (Cx14CxxC type)